MHCALADFESTKTRKIPEHSLNKRCKRWPEKEFCSKTSHAGNLDYIHELQPSKNGGAFIIGAKLFPVLLPGMVIYIKKKRVWSSCSRIA